MSNAKRKEIETLIDKGAAAGDSADAVRFTQAACNAANAMCALKEAERVDREDPSRVAQ